MEINEREIKDKYINILTTRKVDEIIKKQNLGEKITKVEKIWFNNEVGVRKAKLQFAMTKKELDEYTKCKLNIHYFAEKYCKIKREDGTIGPMVLRGYQKDIIDLFSNNNYSILMASRQTGKCLTFTSVVKLKDEYGNEYGITVGELYYSYLLLERNLTIIENIKFLLYKILKYL